MSAAAPCGRSNAEMRGPPSPSSRPTARRVSASCGSLGFMRRISAFSPYKAQTSARSPSERHLTQRAHRVRPSPEAPSPEPPGRNQTFPSRCTSSARFFAPIFLSAFEMWFSTVRLLRFSRSAISGFDRLEASRATSSSRLLSAG